MNAIIQVCKVMTPCMLCVTSTVQIFDTLRGKFVRHHTLLPQPIFRQQEGEGGGYLEAVTNTLM